MDHPSISVIMPVYNGEKFIANAINSILSQRLKPDQLIIVNDGSTDNTENIIIDYEKKYPKFIKYIKQINKGPSEARNNGINKSSGNYLAFIDADDEWEINKLELQMKKFSNSNFPNLGLIYSDYTLIETTGTTLKNNISHIITNYKGNIYLPLITNNKICNSTVIIKKTCFDQCGPFNSNLRGAEDWDLWLKISQIFQVDFCAEKLTRLRLHKNNSSKNTHLMLSSEIFVLLKQAEAQTDNTIIKQIKNSLNNRIIWNLPITNSYKLLKKSLTPRLKNKIYGNGIFTLEWSLILTIIIKTILFPINAIKRQTPA